MVVLKIFRTLLLPLGFLIVWTARFVSRWRTVRFATFWHSRLGHMIGNTECYLSERDDFRQPEAIDIWFPDPEKDANPVISRKYRRQLHMLPSWLARPVFAVNGLYPDWQRHIALTAQVDRDIHGLWATHAPHIGFTEKEERRGKQLLAKLGILDGAPWVCLMVRDAAYLQSRFPRADWSYHDYRDSDISDYVPSAVELVRRGYYVVRMGARVAKPFFVKHSHIIDYAVNGRSDFGDLYLGAKCAFCLGTMSGFTAIPMAFGRPLAVTDFAPLEYAPTWARGVMIWKHHEKDGKHMGVREICDAGLGLATFAQQFEQAKVKLIANTPQEIYECAMETAERVENWTWDHEPQTAFWDNFPTSMVNGAPANVVKRIRIGREFMKGYQ